MATILDRYGIKEVADVTFYEIVKDADGKETPGAPVLYLDTLKVSTIEQTAESADARGGKGNAALITWDYGKEITVTLEDALYSAKSLALMFGDVDEKGLPAPDAGTSTIRKTLAKANVHSASGTNAQFYFNDKLVNMTECKFYNENGGEASADAYAYVTGQVKIADAITIDVSANAFPGTYYITGDTFARSETTGKDELFQFIIPKAKVLSESNTLTLEAEGDPTVFSMSLKVLRPRNGQMMQLVQYNFHAEAYVDSTVTPTPTPGNGDENQVTPDAGEGEGEGTET